MVEDISNVVSRLFYDGMLVFTDTASGNHTGRAQSVLQIKRFHDANYKNNYIYMSTYQVGKRVRWLAPDIILQTRGL